MMITRKITALLGGLMWVACSDSPVNETRSADERAKVEDAIQIAVIRHMIDEGGDDLSGGDAMNDVVCVGVAPGPDPSPAVLEAFKDREPPVRPASECGSDAWEDLINYRVHIPSGRGAIEYSLSAINDPDAGRVSLRVDYYSGGMSAGWWTCSVEKTATRWKVESCKGAATS